MDMNEQDRISASVFIFCQSIENLDKTNEWICSIQKNKVMDIKDIFLVTDRFSKNEDLDSVSQYVIAPGDSISDVWNRCAEDAGGEVFLFLRDCVLDRQTDTPKLICRFLMESEFDALSPAVYSRSEKQYIYSGDDYNQAFFSGFLKMKSPGEVIYEEMDLASNITSMLTAQSLSEDCFAIKATAFRTSGGFLSSFHHYLALGISCRLIESGKIIGWAPKLVLEISRLYCNYEEQFGAEFLQLLESFGYMYSEKTRNVIRGVYCPRGGLPKEKQRGRVLLCSHELTRTGAPVVLLEMGKRLDKLGFQVFFASTADGPLSNTILEEGFPLIVDEMMIYGRARQEKDTVFEPWLFDNILEIFDKIQLNTLVCHNLISKFRDKNIPIIWWLHEAYTTLDYVGQCIPEDLGKNTQVYCVGGFSKSAMNSYGLFPDAEILNYGVEDQFLGEFKKSDMGKRKLKFLLAGSFSIRKGQDVLIDSILLLPLRYLLQTEFYFVGHSSEEAISEKIHAFCTGWPNAHELPAMPRDELFKLYNSMDVIVSPSRDDPMPVVMTEGMMFYKVCICSDGTGTSYYVRNGENGFVCRKDDPEDLARCIMEVVDRMDDLDDMRRKSRRVYEEQFSIPVFDARLEEIFG